MLYLKFSLVVWCLQLFGEDSWFPLPSSTPHLYFPSISMKFECQNDCLPCPIEISAELSLNPSTQNLSFHLSQQNIILLNQTLLHVYLAYHKYFYQSSQALINHNLLILTRRELSPDLVGLATRLGVVWCCPWILPFQSLVDLGTNTRPRESSLLMYLSQDD